MVLYMYTPYVSNSGGDPQEKKKMKTYTVGSMFAGIGGICRAFEDVGCEIEWANEIDEFACMTYAKNMKRTKLIKDDVKNIKLDKSYDTDILTAGFPCQPFSLAGLRRGFDDPRGKLFSEIIRIMGEVSPRAVFLENVSNLKTHDGGRTLSFVEAELRKKGYYVTDAVMNTKDYGNLPQYRNRIYFVAFKDKMDFDSFKFPGEIELKLTLEKILKRDVKQSDKYYYSERNAKHFNVFEKEITKMDTVYQWRRDYVRENKNKLCPTLTANMGMGGHNVPIIKDKYGIRKLTPRECLDFQGFYDDFKFAEISDSDKYKQVGNSVSLPVVKRIAESMMCAMRETDEMARERL